jgi:flagellar basal-body rod modification protein FlgD
MVAVTVVNALGQPVWETTAAPTGTGRHEITWDGSNASGDPVDPGFYHVEARAVDNAGIVTMPTTFVSGRVSGVDTTTGEPLLKVGDLFVPPGDVVAVRAPAPSSEG